jgi:hypothetical protein
MPPSVRARGADRGGTPAADGWRIQDLLTVSEAEQLLLGAAGAADLTVNVVDGLVARPLTGGLGDSRSLLVAFDSFARGASLLIPGLQHRRARHRAVIGILGCPVDAGRGAPAFGPALSDGR